MSVDLITNGIKTVLQPLVDDQKVVAIYDHSSPERTGYPRIEVVNTGMTTERMTNRERLERYTFDIIVSQEATSENAGSSNAHTTVGKVMKTVFDELDAEMDSSTPLNATCEWVEGFESNEVREVREAGLIVHTITITAVKSSGYTK